MSMNYRILVVEDRDTVNDMITEYLEQQEISVDQARHGLHALQFLSTQEYDCIILDLMMPYMDGMTFLEEIRRVSNTPIIILSAKLDEEDKIQAFQLGADEYITKPVGLRELAARIFALLRRTQQKTPQAKTQQRIILLAESNTILVNGMSIVLTKTETKILQLLISQPNQPFSRKALSNHLYQRDYQDADRAIDVHIFNLRKKIEQDAKNPKYVITIHGHGYAFSTTTHE